MYICIGPRTRHSMRGLYNNEAKVSMRTQRLSNKARWKYADQLIPFIYICKYIRIYIYIHIYIHICMYGAYKYTSNGRWCG